MTGKNEVESLLRLSRLLQGIIGVVDQHAALTKPQTWALILEVPPVNGESAAAIAGWNLELLLSHVEAAASCAASLRQTDLLRSIRAELDIARQELLPVVSVSKELSAVDESRAVNVCSQTLRRVSDMCARSLRRYEARLNVEIDDAEPGPDTNLDGVSAILVEAVRQIGPKGKRSQEAVLSYLAAHGREQSPSYAKQCFSLLVKTGVFVKGQGGYRLPEWKS